MSYRGALGAVDVHRVARRQGHLAAAGGGHGAAAPHLHARVAVVVHVHAVVAGALEGDGRVGRVDLEDLVVGEPADLEGGRARGSARTASCARQVERLQVRALRPGARRCRRGPAARCGRRLRSRRGRRASSARSGPPAASLRVVAAREGDVVAGDERDARDGLLDVRVGSGRGLLRRRRRARTTGGGACCGGGAAVSHANTASRRTGRARRRASGMISLLGAWCLVSAAL